MILTVDQALAVAKSTVRLLVLAELQFRSQTVRLTNGAGVADIGGYEWIGMGAVGSIDGLDQSRNGEGRTITLTLSGTAGAPVTQGLMAKALSETSEVRGRDLLIYLQTFDDNWQPIGGMAPWQYGIMQRLTVERSEGAADDGGSRSIKLEAENIWQARSMIAAGRWNDADHQSKFPGDQFFRFAGVPADKRSNWPSV